MRLSIGFISRSRPRVPATTRLSSTYRYLRHHQHKMSRISLTETESKICTLLDECTTHLREEQGITTSCRIAGGWVRDKLLGLESNDIDVALSDMMGVQFAQHLLAFAQSKGLAVGTIAKIESNPDQSKHLETARFTVYGIEMDLVNLRSEEYAANSRIPTQVTFGTPLQDALRRDITINALFFNVHSRSVEDLTEKGLSDLNTGVIRTPLSPKETFMDDPLRVIRCIRFASRLNFRLMPELEHAAKDPEIQAALASKISRERVGEEFTKMLKGKDPSHSLQLIDELSLYQCMFAVFPEEVEASFSGIPGHFSTSISATRILYALLDPSSPSSFSLPPLHPLFLQAANADPTCRYRLYLAAALTPYLHVTYTDKKGKEHSASESVIRDCLKLGSQYHFLDGVPALFAAANLLKNPDVNEERLLQPVDRVAIGLLLRDKAVHCPITGSHWTSSLLFSLLQELVPLYDLSKGQLDESSAAQIIEKYNRFLRKVEELDLVGCADARTLLDGKEVIKALSAQRPGVWTGAVLSQVVAWQLQHPEGTKEQCAEWLRAEKEAGRVSTVDPASSKGGPASKRQKTKR